MQFGVCGDTHVAATARRTTYDYMEWSVAELLKPLESDDIFRAGLDAVRNACIRYPVANCFVPGHMKITGAEVDISALGAFVAKTMQRAEQADVEVIVLGSGEARRIPQGFDPKLAHDQLITFCAMVAPLAQDHGVTVVIEPLNQQECNVLNTVDECAALVNDVGSPAIRLLVDAYHLMRDNDAYESIVTHGALLAHAHIATTPHRCAPAAEPCDFRDFFAALAKARYTGRLSIEGSIEDAETELPAALAMMRGLAGL